MLSDFQIITHAHYVDKSEDFLFDDSDSDEDGDYDDASRSTAMMMIEKNKTLGKRTLTAVQITNPTYLKIFPFRWITLIIVTNADTFFTGQRTLTAVRIIIHTALGPMNLRTDI